MEDNLLNSISPFSKIKKEYNIIINPILFKLSFTILLIFLIIIEINFQNFKDNQNILKIKQIIKNKNDLQLYLKNKTSFFLKKRLIHLKRQNIKYNESKLITFQDKINWLIIHESPEYKSNIVDKIKLHEYSKKILGKDICVPIIKIYNNINEIKLNELPKKFVLKLNHGSGMNIICKNKLKLNLYKAKLKLKKWKNMNFGLKTAEFQYMFVNPKIYAEKYLSDNLMDYKIFCFNGKPEFIRVRKFIPGNKTKIHSHNDTNWKLNKL